jgi:hypothetical protein
LVLPDPIIESVIAYVHWLLLCLGTLSLIRVAAPDGFIPSDEAIDEPFRNCGASFRAERAKLQMQATLAEGIGMARTASSEPQNVRSV